MITERHPVHTVGRLAARAGATIAGILGGLFCYFVCQGMFAGYPRYHTRLLSIAGMIIIMATAGTAWIVDERRIRDDR